jgi:hypothetical protein
MNPNSRTIKVIETSLSRVERSVDVTDDVAMDALALLDEMRRLERKWGEQVAAKSPRRKPTDYLMMEGWCRRWMLATAKLAAAGLSADVSSALIKQRDAVEKDFTTDRFRKAAQTIG